jgi:hypothetical protein
MAPVAFMAMLLMTIMMLIVAMAMAMFLVAMVALLVVMALDRIVMILDDLATLDHAVIPVWLATIIPGVDRGTDGSPETGPQHGTVTPAHFGTQGAPDRAPQGATDRGIGSQVPGHSRDGQQRC